MSRVICALLAILALSSLAFGQTDAAAKLEQLESKLARMRTEVELLASEVAELKSLVRRTSEPAHSGPARSGSAQGRPVAAKNESNVEFVNRILEPDLGGSERENELNEKPEIFVQTRFSTLPDNDATIEDIKSNFRLSRIETRWSGRVSDTLGLGLEIQYHPAPDGAPEELVNDAYVERYLGDHLTARAGQFVKPFGFDIQQSSSVRESPERAIFAGYLFPGQRDRGVMLFGDLDFASSPALKNLQYWVGVFNGNRFFTDSDRQVNYVFRVRKRFARINLAAGASVQLGNQMLPPGIVGNNDENVFGIDVQYAWRRLGFRAEFVTGNMPSTLLGLDPEFAPAFRPGRSSSGGAIFGTVQLTDSDNVYARYDQFNGDPVSGRTIRAFNFGYFRGIGESSRIGIDYQFKNRLSFNDDAVNTRLQATWGITF